MYSIPTYRSTVSLIPGGCPQFLDFLQPLDTISKGVRYFQEKNDPTGIAEKKVLRCLVEDEDGALFDEMSGEPIRANVYEVSTKKSLDPWLEQWLPVPFLRTREQKWEDGQTRFNCGPSNWARVRMVRQVENNTPSLRVVLVFDMTVEEAPKDLDHYFALSPADIDDHATFQLAPRSRDNAWFLNQKWVDEWLANAWKAYKSTQKGRSEDEFSLEYLASYLTMLGVLTRALGNLTIQTAKPADVPIDVDLVLDIGNSRTTGMLVETRTQRATDLNDSYLLQLRDLDKPENVYMEPFETRVEFSEASFGDESLSRQSGRRTAAFVWPSAVRIGPEASRLSTLAVCDEGITGMSSPKRYLWDERDWISGWRYNTKGGKEPRATRGALPRVVNSSGTPLCCMHERIFRTHPLLREQEREMAFVSNFTRSSLMMFLLVEILQQALLTINSPGQRYRRELPNVPRRLRQVIFTVPSGMPIAEQRIYRRWVNWAVRVLWEISGWQEFYVPDQKKAPPCEDYRLSPRVRSNWDEATCTQLVYVYNEITNKFQGDAHTLCKTVGMPRPEYANKPCVRIATIDIGGGTTDLSITTFLQENELGATSRMSPHIELRDGFNIAGDDIIREVIRFILLPCIANAMAAAGVPHPDNLLARLFGKNQLDDSQENRNKRAQCARQLLMPAALGLMAAYEKTNPFSGDGSLVGTLQDVFLHQHDADGEPSSFQSTYPLPSAAVIAYVEKAVIDAKGSPDFCLMKTPIRTHAHKIDTIIKETMGAVLSNLCEVIQRYDCDMLLLTGRPSRWRAIVSSIYAKLPLPPARIMPMGDYRVDTWYPFADTAGAITDPKTTVVVGAILCSLAEGHLEGFSFDPSSLSPTSTARFIGEMDKSGQIKKPKVWFGDLDVNSRKKIELTKEVQFSGPIAIGFRLLDVERWTTTRFYILDFAREEARRSSTDRIPFTIKMNFLLQEIEEDESGRVADAQERDEGELTIDTITDRFGDEVKAGTVQIRLQTLPLDEGVWLDTGIVL